MDTLMVKLRPAGNGGAWLCIPAEDLFVTMGEMGEDGATWEVQMHSMSDEQVAALPEFEGW